MNLLKNRKIRYVLIAVAVTGLVFGASRMAKAQTAAEMKPVYNTGYCSTMTGGNWSDVKLESCDGDINQLWYTQQNAAGYYNIVNYNGVDCMQDGNNGPSGTDLTVYACNGSTSQEFTTQTGEVWKAAAADDVCIDNGQSNRVVWWYTCNGTHSQDWE